MKSLVKMQDSVIFMTAYKVTEYKHKAFKFRKCKLKQDALKRFHIESVIIGNNILTPKGVLKYQRVFNECTQSTAFEFDVVKSGDELRNYKNEITHASWISHLFHSNELILDSRFFHIPICVTLERFLVLIEKRILQVNPVAFFVNDVLFIDYELIDYETNTPLKKDEIYGRDNNYNLLYTEKLRYFDEDTYECRADKIVDIIFENVSKCLETLLNDKFKIDAYSFLHNTFVATAQVDDLEEYFSDVLGAKDLELNLKNINNNQAYKYYSKEYLGVVTAIDSDCMQQALSDCHLLEVMKMYFMIKQIVNYDITNDLETTIDRQFEIERLMYLTKVPIITLNAIENLKHTTSFKLFSEAIDFKISYLKIFQENKKNKNALLLNVLLYILAFISRE